MDIDMEKFLSGFEIVEDDPTEEAIKKRAEKVEGYKQFIDKANIPVKFQGACKETIGEKIFNDILSDKQIFLKGQLGRGKSYSACGYLNTIFLEKKISGVFVRCHQLENMDLNDLKKYINSLEKRMIVVFDDIGYINGNEFVKRLVKDLPKDCRSEIDSTIATNSLMPNSLIVTVNEGWRGEICHVAITNNKGKFDRYKIVDPSFHNWMGLAISLRKQEIADFPICNKSFNLSYCGHDL